MPVEFTPMTSRSSVSHASTILDQVSIRAASANAWTGVQLLSVVFVTVLTAVAAQVSFPLPFTPVPFTLQPMIVLVGGAALGARLGFTSQALYLLAGIAGLPVFAASGTLPQGFLRLLGPTGGFLMAYPFAAFVAGNLAERGFDRRYATSVLAMGAGLAIIFACGVAWMAFGTPHLGLSAAIAGGLVPFIPADLFKIAASATVLPMAWRFLRR